MPGSSDLYIKVSYGRILNPKLLHNASTGVIVCMCVCDKELCEHLWEGLSVACSVKVS